jgi:cytosine/adenosine deaminase-related metal-dependent hydrolase
MSGVTHASDHDDVVLDRLASPDATRVLIRGASVISMDTEIGDLARGDILVADGRIVAVGPDLGEAAADGQALEIDGTGTIAIPGLQDTHRHSWQAQLRRLRPDGDLGGYIELLHFRIAPAYTPEDVYVGNLLAALGALDAGVTCMLDFSHITLAPEYTDAAIRGLRDAGVRAVFASGPPVSGDGLAWHRDLRRVREEQLSSDDALVTMRMGLYSTIGDLVQPPKGLSVDNLRLAAELDVGVTVDAVFGANAGAEIETLGRAGALHADLTFIHCQSIGDAAWREIAACGASVALAVTSDALLGCESAIPPIQQAVDHGLTPGLSVDVECCLTSDIFSQMQATLMIQRMLAYHHRHTAGEPASEVKLLRARDVLGYATIAGARANGVARVTGSITPGKAADIVLLRADAVANMPLNNAVATVVMGADTRHVDTVLVAGRPRKWRGTLVDVDREALLRHVTDSRDAVLERIGHDLDVTL